MQVSKGVPTYSVRNALSFYTTGFCRLPAAWDGPINDSLGPESEDQDLIGEQP